MAATVGYQPTTGEVNVHTAPMAKGAGLYGIRQRTPSCYFIPILFALTEGRTKSDRAGALSEFGAARTHMGYTGLATLHQSYSSFVIVAMLTM